MLRIPAFACVPLLLLSATISDAAPIVYSNLGDPPQFDTANGWEIDGGVVGGQMMAAQFTAITNRPLWFVRLALGVIFTNAPEFPVSVSIAEDSLGTPGATLADLHLDAMENPGPFPPGDLLTFSCSLCLTLEAGKQYWVVASIPNPALDVDHFESTAAWNWNAILDYSTGTNVAYNDTALGTGWQYLDGAFLRPAFEVTMTPEPGSLAGVAVALALLWRRRARR